VVLAALALAAPARAASVERAGAELARRLADRVHLCLGLGDGRGAARALAALAAVTDRPAQLAVAVWPVLDAYEVTGLPDDFRGRFPARDPESYRRIAEALVASLGGMTAEHPLPAEPAGRVLLGAEDGCPVRHARAFARGPGGRVIALAEGLAWYDGRRWQVVPPWALRVREPILAVFTDSRERTWLGGPAGAEPTGPGGTSEAFASGSVALFEVGDADFPGRWRVFKGTRSATAFAESGSGVWIAGPDRLFLSDGDRAAPVACPLPYSPFRRLLARPDADGVWVVDLDRVSRFDGSRWTSYALGSRDVRDAVAAARPVLVLKRGLLILADDGFEWLEAPRRVNALADAAVAPDGTVWCVSVGGQVLTTDLRSWRMADVPEVDERLHPWPSAIFCDDEGRVWLSRGAGIEVFRDVTLEDPADPRPEAVELDRLPLVGLAGSGGWLEDASPPARREAPEEPSPTRGSTAEDLGGFAEEAGAPDETPAQVFEALREDPGSAALYEKLFSLLAAAPDLEMRRAALALAADAENAGLFRNPGHVRELAELLLDRGEAAQAFMILSEAHHRGPEEGYPRELEPALFEALVAMGFGEFARPAFLEADLAWAAPAGQGRRPGAVVTVPQKESELGVRNLRAVGLDLSRGAAEPFREARLPQARILAQKRQVLGSVGDVKAWEALLDACLDAGDVAAAERYRGVARKFFALTERAGEHRAVADTVGLSPFRWIRRLKLEADSALPPMAEGERIVVLDEGANRRLALDTATGAPHGEQDFEEGFAARALLPGAAALCTRDGEDRVFYVGREASVIEGLTGRFDAFSATPVRDGVFYCLDGGLTKVDLSARRIVWRSERVTGGLSFWLALLERSVPVAAGGEVFVVSNRKLFCVDAGSGEVRWSKACGARGTPAAAGGVVVVGAERREVWGLRRATGEVAWRHIGPEEAQGVVVTDGERVFSATAAGHVTALRADTGEFLWRRSTDIGLRRPASDWPRPTALLVRGGRVIACNNFGYLEFDAETGAVLRRLHVTTARPMVATEGGIVVATAPDRLVCIADPPRGELGRKMTALARSLADEGRREPALEVARLVANYVEPARLAAHALALELAADGPAPRGGVLYRAMVASADPFTPAARAAMRKHLGHWATKDNAVLHRVAGAHIERGAVRQAVRAFEELNRTRRTAVGMRLLLRLQIAAGGEEEARRTAERLAALGPSEARVAFAELAENCMEEAALDLAADHAKGKEGLPLLYMAVSVSGASGLFEKAEAMVRRPPVELSGAFRGQALAYLFSNAHAAERILAKEAEAIRDELEGYRKLLLEARERLTALDGAAKLEVVETRLRRLEEIRFP